MRFGVEIEIGTDYQKTREVHNLAYKLGWEPTCDGSVSCYTTSAKSEEYRSKVYTLQAFPNFKSDLKKLAKYFKEANRTMGYHVHISFKNLEDYSKIFCKDFKDRFLESLREKANKDNDTKFLGRYTNRYCVARYDDVDYFERMRIDRDDRYKAINFICAYQQHKTIEFRIFPSSKSAEVLTGYTKFLLDFVTDYLRKSTKIDKNINAEKEKLKGLRKKTEEEIEATPIKKKIGGIEKCALRG
jgi:hypothetical protein